MTKFTKLNGQSSTQKNLEQKYLTILFENQYISDYGFCSQNLTNPFKLVHNSEKFYLKPTRDMQVSYFVI